MKCTCGMRRLSEYKFINTGHHSEARWYVKDRLAILHIRFLISYVHQGTAYNICLALSEDTSLKFRPYKDSAYVGNCTCYKSPDLLLNVNQEATNGLCTHSLTGEAL